LSFHFAALNQNGEKYVRGYPRCTFKFWRLESLGSVKTIQMLRFKPLRSVLANIRNMLVLPLDSC
jgi:hypothetical protein